MNITVKNLTSSQISTSIGLVQAGQTVTSSLDPMTAYKAAVEMKTLVDAGRIAVTITDEANKLDAMEPGLANGVITGAKLKKFVSGQLTGTGASQNIAHGLGVIPSVVLWAIEDSATGVFTVVEGVHTITNVVLTVTLNVKFKVLAIA